MTTTKTQTPAQRVTQKVVRALFYTAAAALLLGLATFDYGHLIGL